MIIRIEASDLPGLTCGPSPDRPGGHHGIHVAVQGRKGQHDLVGVVPADQPTATWELPCSLVSGPPGFDVRGPQIHGRPGHRFIYLSWGVTEGVEQFTMFRRAKLPLDAVPAEVAAEATAAGRLVARLGLTDARGNPRCGSVGSPVVTWSAG